MIVDLVDTHPVVVADMDCVKVLGHRIVLEAGRCTGLEDTDLAEELLAAPSPPPPHPFWDTRATFSERPPTSGMTSPWPLLPAINRKKIADLVFAQQAHREAQFSLKVRPCLRSASPPRSPKPAYKQLILGPWTFHRFLDFHRVTHGFITGFSYPLDKHLFHVGTEFPR